jgi:hypothetical protein
LELIPHYSDARRTLLFVANPMTEPLETVVRFTGARTFAAAWGPALSTATSEALELRLEPYSLRILEVTS